MQWIPDKTLTFKERPKYLNEELEARCDDSLNPVLLSRHGNINRPANDDDLTVLLESLGADVDLEAEFPPDEGWVQGATDFFLKTGPIVRIRRSLSENPSNFNRYKTTLGHETGHVLCLREPFEREGNVLNSQSRYLRYSGDRAQVHDWKEHQADYCSGALLMPRRMLTLRFGSPPSQDSRLWISSGEASKLIARVAQEFRVSFEAARVRLTVTGYLRRSHQLVLPMGTKAPRLWSDKDSLSFLKENHLHRELSAPMPAASAMQSQVAPQQLPLFS